MILLVTQTHPTMIRHADRGIGRLVQPRHYSSIEATAALGIPWAADNDCFQGLDASAFLKMLDRIQGLPGCLFVVCPDVVANNTATLNLFDEWREEITDRALPVAIALQDGMTIDDVPWHLIDAVFVGGTTAYKIGLDASTIVAEARTRDLWTHMGRVNTPARIRYAASIGIQSIDGSSWARWPKVHIPRGLTLTAAPPQLRFEET